MGNRKLEKIQIDGERLKEIIKSSGYTIKELAGKIEWSDRSIRNAIKEGECTEDLLNTLSEVLDYDMSRIRKKPEPVNTNVKLRENIKALTKWFDISSEELAVNIGVEESELLDAINNKTPITETLMEKLSAYFDLPAEMIKNNDFTEEDVLTYDPTVFYKNIDIILPLFSSDEALTNSTFKKAYDSHQKLLEAQKNLNILDAEEMEKIINDCSACYENVDSGEYTEEAWANALSFSFFLLISAKGTEIIARYVHHQEQYPAMVNKIKDSNPELKAILESVEQSDEIEDEYLFEDLIKDPEFNNDINRALRHLKRNYEWSDLADYYICLQYICAAVDNSFSSQQNREFGIELMLKFKSLKNKYAKRYVSIIYE